MDLILVVKAFLQLCFEQWLLLFDGLRSEFRSYYHRNAVLRIQRHVDVRFRKRVTFGFAYNSGHTRQTEILVTLLLCWNWIIATYEDL